MKNGTGALPCAATSPRATDGASSYIPAMSSPFRYIPEQRTARPAARHFYFRPVQPVLARIPLHRKAAVLSEVGPGREIGFTATIDSLILLTGGRRILFLVDAGGHELHAHVDSRTAHTARRLLVRGRTLWFTAVTRPHEPLAPRAVDVLSIQAVKTR